MKKKEHPERLDEVQAAHRMVRAFTEKYETPAPPHATEEDTANHPAKTPDAVPKKTKTPR